MYRAGGTSPQTMLISGTPSVTMLMSVSGTPSKTSASVMELYWEIFSPAKLSSICAGVTGGEHR